MQKLIRGLIIIFLFTSLNALAQSNGEVRGFVYDKSTSEPVIFTTVYLDGTNFGISTDINGYFSITKVPAGSYTLKVTSVEYADFSKEITIVGGKIITERVELEESNVQLDEVTISGKKIAAQEQIQIGISTVKPREIKIMPSVGGEPDLAQYIQTLPGVVFTGDQGGQLFIRGGSPVQNLILLDGLLVYNPFHSIGLFSIFDTDILKNVDIYTGGFNAEYGGRTSAVIDVTTKDGNKNRTTGKVSANPFTSKLTLEGPISKNENGGGTSFVLSGRTSYLDRSSKIFYDYVEGQDGLPYSFNDIYGKVSTTSAQGSKVSLYGFNFQDRAGLDSTSTFGWDQFGVGGNFIFLPSGSSQLISGTLGYSSYDIGIEEATQSPRSSQVTSFNFGLDFTYFISKSEIKWGIQYVGNSTTFNTVTPNNVIIEDNQNNTEMAGYFKYRFVRSRFVIEPSVRLQYYASLGNLRVEPRIGGKFNITDDIRIKGAWGQFSQNLIATRSDRDVVNLFAGYISSPGSLFDENRNSVELKLQTATHYIAGVEFDLFRDKVEVNIEPYIKDFTQNININRLKVFAGDPDFVIENGQSRGIDFQVKYDNKDLYAQVTYSLGYNERRGPVGDGIVRQGVNDNASEPLQYKVYNPSFDRRHNINMMASYTLGDKDQWEISGRWNFGSGFPFTQTVGFYENITFDGGSNADPVNENGELGIIYDDFNQGRLPYYHRLDLSAKRKFEFSKNSILEVSANVINVYDRENLFYFDRVNFERVNQLPILPSLGLSWSF